MTTYRYSKKGGILVRSRRQFMGGSGAALMTAFAGGAAWAVEKKTAPKPVANSAAPGARPIAVSRRLEEVRAADAGLYAVALDALAHTKYAFVSVASGQGIASGNPLADAMRPFIASRKATKKARYTDKAKALLAATPQMRAAEFGRYASVSPVAFVSLDHSRMTTQFGKVAGPKPDLSKLLTLNRAGSIYKPTPPFDDGMIHCPNGVSFYPSQDPSLNHCGSQTQAELDAAIYQLGVEEQKKIAAQKAIAEAHKKDVEEGAQYDRLEFFITKVVAVQLTGDQGGGGDEIAIGGAAQGPTGHTEKIKQRRVKDEFEYDATDAAAVESVRRLLPAKFKGMLARNINAKVYKGGKTIAGFKIVRPELGGPGVEQILGYEGKTTTPLVQYSVTLGMAELDGGGFDELVQAIWEAVRTFVIGALQDLVMATSVAAAIGSVIPGFGTLVGAVIGAFCDWLASLFHNGDDIMGMNTWNLLLTASTKSHYRACLIVPPGTQSIVQDYGVEEGEGHYQIHGGWRVTTA